MIEKKIKYEVNIEKPSKTKPVKQGGVLNYLGKQKTVNAPRRWRSSANHPIAHLAYITKDEEKILIDLNLYGSLKGKPNKGPSGIMSLQGSGGGSEGAGSDSSGTGASEGTAQGPGPNEGAEAGQAAANAAEAAADAAAAAAQNSFSPDIGGIVGPGPGQQDVTGFGTDYSDADMGPVGPNAMGQVDALAQTLEDQANREKNPATARLSPLGVAAYNMSLTNPTRTTAEKAMGLVTSPLSTLAATAYDAYARGVTAPDDYSQLDTSVQNAPSQSPSDGGGINTLQAYAPLYNSPVTSGDSTMDAYIRRLRINLGLPV
jgi:hypothetical protein